MLPPPSKNIINTPVINIPPPFFVNGPSHTPPPHIFVVHCKSALGSRVSIKSRSIFVIVSTQIKKKILCCQNNLNTFMRIKCDILGSKKKKKIVLKIQLHQENKVQYSDNSTVFWRRKMTWNLNDIFWGRILNYSPDFFFFPLSMRHINTHNQVHISA